MRGLQSAGVIATLKHFVGYSASRAGRNLAPVSIGPRELADVAAAALRAGPARRRRLGDELLHRRRRGACRRRRDAADRRCCATGSVSPARWSPTTSAIAFLQPLHGVAADTAPTRPDWRSPPASTSSCPRWTATAQPLIAAVEGGEVDEAAVDRALRAGAAAEVAARAARSGLDAGAAAAAEARPVDLDDAPVTRLAREVAERSIVLLHNDGDLPLAPARRVAVVGPRADTAQRDARLLLLSDARRRAPPGRPARRRRFRPSWTRLRADAAAYDVSTALGCPVVRRRRRRDRGSRGRVRFARRGVRRRAGRPGRACSVAERPARAMMSAHLRLPGRQEELLEALLATGTPVVLVLHLRSPVRARAPTRPAGRRRLHFLPRRRGRGRAGRRAERTPRPERAAAGQLSRSSGRASLPAISVPRLGSPQRGQ